MSPIFFKENGCFQEGKKLPKCSENQPFPHIAYINVEFFSWVLEAGFVYKVSEESDKFFVVIECFEHNQSENMDF